jgi:DNA polymerase-3 subunit delta
MNLFLISSSSYNETNEEIKKITGENATIINFDLEESSINDVIEEANYVSLFADQKYIVINNAYIFTSEQSKEEDLNSLLNYIEKPNPSSILIFTTLKPLDERKKIVKTFKEKAKVIVKKPLNEKELVALIQNKLKEHKKTISLASASQMVLLCQNNYDLIIKEIDKLLIYYDHTNEIPDDEISNIISNDELINNFDFSDAVINKNQVKAFSIFDKLKETKEEPVMLIGLLASQYRLIYKVKYYLNKNYDKSSITSELKIHPYRVELAIKNAYNFTEKELLNKISLLADLDYKIKSGQVDGYAGLEMFLLEL